MRAVAAALCLALAAPALGQGSPELAAARAAGILGERFDGDLGYTAGASERVRREAGAINIKRRSLYSGLAARRNATVQEVGIAAGCELLADVKVGEIYMLNDGVWHRRSPGQAVAVPAYCGR